MFSCQKQNQDFGYKPLHTIMFFLQKILMFLKKWCNKQHDIGPCNELTGDRSAMDNMCMVITCIFDGCCTSVGPNTYLGNTKSRREMNAIFTTMAGERILHIPRTSNLSASMEELVVDAALAAVAQGRLQSRNRQVCTLLEGQAEPLGTLTVRFLVGQAEAAEYSRVTRVWRAVFQAACMRMLIPLLPHCATHLILF